MKIMILEYFHTLTKCINEVRKRSSKEFECGLQPPPSRSIQTSKVERKLTNPYIDTGIIFHFYDSFSTIDYRFQIIHPEETCTIIKQTSEYDKEEDKKPTPSSEDREDDIIRPTHHSSFQRRTELFWRDTLRRENKPKQIALKLLISKEYVFKVVEGAKKMLIKIEEWICKMKERVFSQDTPLLEEIRSL